jgi:hypothetical protein
MVAKVDNRERQDSRRKGRIFFHGDILGKTPRILSALESGWALSRKTDGMGLVGSMDIVTTLSSRTIKPTGYLLKRK